ncbi:glycosyl hydrolase catalytic core-domain-containing protein [Mycena maculata]|uniref:Glycosyl hydrolase catalytic core-domain-containing protein n=1 Tax=Mycena maculata TaxID=230809 RepID=A0AAD7N270_9AGAR|nr:glycosyl hydrolase catalytic core-domain-containing protein [Mycena maculata]
MAPSSLLAILSLTLVALFACSFVTPANAVSLQSSHIRSSLNHGEVARRKSSTSRRKRASNSARCKAPASSSAAISSTTKKASTTSTTPTSTTSTTKKATTTSKAVAAAATTAASSSSSGGVNLRGKACLAWPNYNYNPLAPWKGSQTGLIYSWDAVKVPDADEYDFTYAPMLWGWTNVDDFQSRVVEGYATIALGMNEPNEVGQSNMDAATGISMWREYMMPLASKGYTLISPAMSSNPNGKTWMAQFMSDCGSDCAIGGIATHYYGTDIEEFITYVTYWHTTYNLPVYVTEYADQDFDGGAQADIGEIWAFMEAATAFLNENDWVKAHCWFGAMVGMDNVNPLNTLMNSDGSGPNDLGSWFINN